MPDYHAKDSAPDPTQMMLKNNYNEAMSEAVTQFAASMTNWSQECLAFGARCVSEYAKLMERLMQCQSAPEVMKAEWEYLDAIRQQYASGLPRLLSMNEEFFRRNGLSSMSLSSFGERRSESQGDVSNKAKTYSESSHRDDRRKSAAAE